MDVLSREMLASLAGCDDDRLQQIEQLRIIEAGAAGYAGSDVSRLRLVLALNDAGIALETLAEGLRRQVVSLDFASQLMFEPVTISQTPLSAALERSPLDLEKLNALHSSAGLPPMSPVRALREDDLEFIRLVAECVALGASGDGMHRVLRVFGQSMRRCVDTMRDLFRSEVEAPMLQAGLGHREVLAAGAAKRLELQRIGMRMLFLLQRRLLEEAVFDNVVGRLQEALRGVGDDRWLDAEADRPLPAVAFADLSGFTALTQDIGDLKAAEKAAGFEALAQRLCSNFGGRIVKPLGDGVMMLFPDSGAALRTALSLVEQSAAHDLPDVRVGVATGQVVPRDGDIFGQTVNLAARIAAAAAPSQILACRSTHGDAAGNFDATDFIPLAPLSLKGLPEPVPLYSVMRRL
jgi:adenylate cyclase